MSLHPRLATLPGVDYRGRFDKILKMIEKDLDALECRDWQVQVSRNPDKAPWWKLESVDTPDQIMVVEGVLAERAFRIAVPMRGGNLQPYSIIVRLNVPFHGRAVCGRSLFGKKWMYEDHPERREDLEAIPFPKVNMTHVWGGYTYSLQAAYVLVPDEKDSSKTLWTSYSGFEGFLFGIGPRVAKFLAAAPAIEAALRDWPT